MGEEGEKRGEEDGEGEGERWRLKEGTRQKEN